LAFSCAWALKHTNMQPNKSDIDCFMTPEPYRPLPKNQFRKPIPEFHPG